VLVLTNFMAYADLSYLVSLSFFERTTAESASVYLQRAQFDEFLHGDLLFVSLRMEFFYLFQFTIA
jgi:hypothetical protein